MTTTPQDRAIFEQLLRQHERQLFGFIFSLVRNLADTEDIFQETCVALWEQFDRFEQGTNFAAWASAVARFRMLKFLEREKRSAVAFSEQAQAQLSDVYVQTPVDELEARRTALAGCVEKLNPDQRSLLWQVYDEKAKVADVAAALQRTTHSIYSSLKHIRTKLLECIERTRARELA